MPIDFTPRTPIDRASKAVPVILYGPTGTVIGALAPGQATMANSAPVVIASNQSAVPVDTELPAAALLADNTALPTAPVVGAAAMLHDGTNLDLWKSAQIGNFSTTGNGIAAVGAGMYDNSNGLWRPVRSADSDNLSPALALGVASWRLQGATLERERGPNVFKVVALTAGTAETTIWTPAGGKKFRLMGFLLTCGAGSTLTFKDNTAGTTIFAARGATDTPISPNGMGNGILSGAADRLLTVTRGTSCTLDGVVWGVEE
jgi:hypothetical protein